MSGKKKTILIVVIALMIGILVGGCAVVIGLRMFSASDKKVEKAEKEKDESIVIEEYSVDECIKLGKYKGLEISIAVTEEDIDWEIQSLIEENTTYEQLKGIAQEGNMVYADFEGYVDGERKDSTCGADYITIGSGEWLEGFEDAIIGMQCGQTKEFPVQVPDGTYGDEEIDGKTVDFKLTLQYICGESIVPEYNDEFVQSISNYNTTKEYNKYLKERLAKENEEEKLEYAWSEVYESSKVKKYPKTLMQAARREVLQGYYNMAAIYGVSHDEIFQSFGCLDEQDFVDTQLTELARDTVKEGLVAEAIAKAENLSYTTEEYQDLLKEEYEMNSSSYKSKEEYEEENRVYLERTALMNVVKEWLGENTNYIK